MVGVTSPPAARAAGCAGPPSQGTAYPQITNISPCSYDVTGGGTLTIYGVDFAQGDAVVFGPAGGGKSETLQGVHVWSSTKITATIPPDNSQPGAPGTPVNDKYTVHVRLPDPQNQATTCTVVYCGESNTGGRFVLFTYTGKWARAPILDPGGISPAQGTPRGGTTLTITGQNFTSDAQVVFNLSSGAVSVAPLKVDPSGTTLTVSTPSDLTPPRYDNHIPDTVQVAIHTVGGDSKTEPYTYAWLTGAKPKITSIKPGDGDPKGNQPVVITGTNLGGTDGKPIVTLTYSVPLQPQNCGRCHDETSAFSGVTFVQKGGKIDAVTPDVADFPAYPPATQQPLPPDAHFDAAVPQDATVTVITDSGMATTTYHLDQCEGPPDLNPLHLVLNAAFQISRCHAVGQGFVTWMLQEPDVAGNVNSSNAERRNPTAIGNLERITEGIALGLLGLVFTVSLIRFTVGAVTSGNPGTVIQGIIHPAGAALMVVLWPDIYRYSVIIANTITQAIANGPINLDSVPTVLLGAMLILGLGVGSFLGGLGIIIGIVFVLMGVSLFFALVALKLTLFALMAVVYVAMPALVVVSRFPTYEWLLGAAMRAWVVGLVWPIGWAIILACAAAVFVDGWSLDVGGGLVHAIGNSMVSVMLLIACVKLPGMMIRVALLGTGITPGGRGLGGALIVNHFMSKAIAAGLAAAGVTPAITGIGAKGAVDLGLKSGGEQVPAAKGTAAAGKKLFDAEMHAGAAGAPPVTSKDAANAFHSLHDPDLAARIFDQSFEQASSGQNARTKAHHWMREAYGQEYSRPGGGSQAKLDALEDLGRAGTTELQDGYRQHIKDQAGWKEWAADRGGIDAAFGFTAPSPQKEPVAP
jgi:hypothetical protein